jgi:hypothetical protein
MVQLALKVRLENKVSRDRPEKKVLQEPEVRLVLEVKLVL